MLKIPIPSVELEFSEDSSIAERLSASFNSYLTLNIAIDQNFADFSKQATKSYPIEYFRQLIVLIKKSFPHIGIVQIGSASPLVEGVDISLAGNTTLPQCTAILRRSILHIDGEGGLVHIATSIGTRCAVLFGPISLRFFGYPQNINLKAGECGDCWWSTEDWFRNCPRGFKKNECMYALYPEFVMEKIAPELQKRS